MSINTIDLENEIKELYKLIQKKRKAFDQGMKNDKEFGELKKIYIEIKALKKRLDQCFEKSLSVQKGQ